MGTYDRVTCSDPRIVCSEGHDLRGTDNDLQTKDLGCTMGWAEISDGRLVFKNGDYGEPLPRPFTGVFTAYCACRRCPAFVQAGTRNIVECWVHFEIDVVDDVVRDIRRVSPSTADWLVSEPNEPWMIDCEGPMSWEAAWELMLRYRREG